MLRTSSSSTGAGEGNAPVPDLAQVSALSSDPALVQTIWSAGGSPHRRARSLGVLSFSRFPRLGLECSVQQACFHSSVSLLLAGPRARLETGSTVGGALGQAILLNERLCQDLSAATAVGAVLSAASDFDMKDTTSE